MSQKASRVMAMLSVTDIDKSLAFYRDTLGGTIVYQFPPEGPPVFLTLAFGTTELGIGLVTDAPLHGRPLRPANGHRIELCITVGDTDAAIAALADIGAPTILGATDQPWGERMAYVEDPDGNLVMLAAAIDRQN